jgi:hypothetical protein
MCISCVVEPNDGFDASCPLKFGLENVGWNVGLFKVVELF